MFICVQRFTTAQVLFVTMLNKNVSTFKCYKYSRNGGYDVNDVVINFGTTSFLPKLFFG